MISELSPYKYAKLRREKCKNVSALYMLVVLVRIQSEQSADFVLPDGMFTSVSLQMQ